MRLTEAAQAAGIAAGYHDIWGNWREVPDATLVAALDALGYPGAPEPDALAASLAASIDRQAQCLLPPIALAAADRASRLKLPMSLLPSPEQRHLRWQVTLEDGSQRSGELVADGGAIDLPALPAGCHRLQLAPWTGPAEAVADTTLLVAPARCFLPDALRAGERQWGLAVQLYGLRSARNWGIGDYTDLLALIDTAATLGARVIGLNPLHALSLDRPENSSPYSAVSRLFLHPMYIDPARLDCLADSGAAQWLCHSLAPQARRAALRDTDQVDYAGVSALKLEVLRGLYDAFLAESPDSPGAADFRAFKAASPALLSHATFQSIQLALHAADPAVWGWPCWPEALRDPHSAEVAAWQQANMREIEFHVFLEWQGRRQWARVRDHARAAGIALYGDLALGADRGGSEVWAAQGDHALGFSAGCPPDDFNLQGQDWGLPPLRPDRLLETGCAAFRAVIAAGMAQFDALRLDHVMSLMRLFWIPPGTSPEAGAYVDYPFDALLATLKIESQRARCMLIGEDLGTVPPAVREGLQAADVLSYRLLVFERDSPTHFRLPGGYPRLALAALGSHDLAPLQGWWSADDLHTRARIGLLDAEQLSRFSADRCEARQGLLATLAEAGLMPDGESTDPDSYPLLPAVLIDAVHSFLARTESMWAMVHPEDAFDLIDATNLPGTTREHPNWCRKLPIAVEDWISHPRLQSICSRMRVERG